MRKLISMVDFIINQGITDTHDTSEVDWYYKEVQKLDAIRNYANFLKQPLEIWQFLPCNENNLPLHEPEHYDWWYKYGISSQYGEHLTSVCEPYFKAKSRCIFEGFKIANVSGYDIERNYILFRLKDYSSIEDFANKTELELTASAIKELGL